MKRDSARKISAVLFLLCALLTLLDMSLTLSYYWENYTFKSPETLKAVAKAGGILFACAVAVLGIFAWLNNKSVLKIGALAAAVASFIQFMNYVLQYEKEYQNINWPWLYNAMLGVLALPALFCALSCLLLFFAQYTKKWAFAVSCCSSLLAVFAAISRVMEMCEEGGISPLLLALAILFWGISRRRVKMPALSAWASAGDAISALEKLDGLRRSGDISQEEYEAEKAKIIKML